MFAENGKTLPKGDASVVFANELRLIARCGTPPSPLDAEHVVQLATKEMQPQFATICRRLLLPGSSIRGWKHIEELARLSRAGKSCLLCLSHVSNLDVPNLYAILARPQDVDVFNQIIWIAGRKLSEDNPLTQVLCQSFNRIVVTPRSWFADTHSQDELQQAHLINRAAQRTMVHLRNQGWIFGLFPSGTRRRPGDESTTEAIPEVDTYVKTFDYMVLCHIEGCTLPVSMDHDFTHEIPTKDRVCYSFGAVLCTSQWRQTALDRFPELGQRVATGRSMMEDIAALGHE